jgi:hypothetical protein
MAFWALKRRLLLKEHFYEINIFVSGGDIANFSDTEI